MEFIYNNFKEFFKECNDFTLVNLLNEWKLYQEMIRVRCKNMSLQEVMTFLHVNNLNDHFPLFSIITEYALSIPLHTVDCERGFSHLNIIKTSLRNRLLIDNISHLLMIKIEGPLRENFNFDKAFEKWSTMAPRRCLQK